MHVGGCACGGVRFEIDGDLGPIQLCHCSICRKSNGSAFAANMPIPAASFHLTSGEELLREFETSPGKRRTFCGTCGSPIHSRADAFPSTLRIRAGALDAPVEARPVFHFFTGSKADWWEITDDLPQYEGRRPA